MIETIGQSGDIGKEDFERAFGLNRTCFSILGIWPEYRAYFRKYIQTPFLIVFLSVCLLIPELWALVLVINNLSLVLDNIFVVTATTTIKLIIYWQSKEKFAEIIVIIMRDWCRNKFDWERDIMLRAARRGQMITISSSVFLISVSLGIYLGPTLGIVLRKINNITDHEFRHLPIQTVYPFDISKTPVFQLAFLSQFLCGIIMFSCFFGTAIFFVCLVCHICGQLEILSMKINNLQVPWGSQDGHETRWLSSSKELDKDIGDIVNNHVHIIKTIDVIERFFRLLLLVEIFNMTYSMCSLGFQVINALGESGQLTFSRILFPVGTGLNTILHSFIYCLCGELLSNCSEELCHCVCQKEWYAFPRRHALDLIPITQQTQIPLQVSAGRIMFLNMATFCGILKTTAGYISVLVAVRQK